MWDAFVHRYFIMSPLYVISLLLLQCFLPIYHCEDISSEEDVKSVENKEQIIEDSDAGSKDFIDYFFGPNSGHKSPSANIMAQIVADSNKNPEEQVDEIKKMASKMCMSIQSELVTLIEQALGSVDKNETENTERPKRSTETPMDSAQLIMRLLKHIKSNNEYQNIAIEKMMSAKEIADKFGIDFKPDPEIFTDLAQAATEQASIFQAVVKNATSVENQYTTEETHFVPLQANSESEVKTPKNHNYYHYHVQNPSVEKSEPISQEKPQEHHHNNIHYIEIHGQPLNTVPQAHYQMQPQSYETQITPPMQQHTCLPVSQRPPAFYEPQISYPAMPEFCSQNSMAQPLTFIEVEPEPELLGEEYEETVSSKVTIDKGDLPGTATVNHVMTYTLSEKAHFKKPEIENLPQQMQYYFYL